MDHLVREYLVRYHTERPHQGVGNVPLGLVGHQQTGQPARLAGTVHAGSGQAVPRRRTVAEALGSTRQAGELACRERLGGLLRHYGWREAA